MSKKSLVVPFGVLPKNENKIKEMVNILKHLHQYVPVYKCDEGVSREAEVSEHECKVYKILLGGNQLTKVRAMSAMRVRSNGWTPTAQLEGFIPVVEDWHTKLCLFEVIWKYYVSRKSAAEHGTAYQLCNLIGRSNVKKDPKNSMNESEDFLSVVLQSYITAAAMQILEMKQVNEWPSSIPKDIWTEQDDVRVKLMESVLSSIVDRFLNIQYNSPHPIPSNGDQVLAYTKALFTMASLYLEFADSIKEGDGDRVQCCWKYFAIIFYNSNSKNYAFEAVYLLYQLKYKLSPQQVEQVLYGRFINHVGSPGRNCKLKQFLLVSS